MNMGKFLKKEMGKALQVLSPKERADMNRYIQSLGKIMSDDNLTSDEQREEVLRKNDEMQKKYADISNK